MSNRLFSLLLLIVLCFASSVAFSQTDKLTKEKIIQIAVKKAQELGYKTKEMNIIYNEGNNFIKKHLTRNGESTYNEATQKWDAAMPTTPEKKYPELKDKEYKSVYFAPKAQGVKGGDLFVFIDADTGETLKHIGGK